MSNKKLKGLILALTTPALMFGCQNSASQVQIDNFVANNYVELCDYKEIYVTKDDMTVSKEDIDSVILFDLQSKGCFVDEKIRPIEYGDFVVMDITEKVNGVDTIEENAFVFIADDENLNDSEREFYSKIVGNIPGEKIEFSISEFDEAGKSVIVNYVVFISQIKSQITELTDDVMNDVYGYESLDEAQTEFEKMIVNGRILDIVKSTIKENCIITNIPPQKNQYIDEMKADINKLARDEKMSVDEYCYDKFGISAIEYYESISDFFDEYLMIKAISEKEGYTYSQDDINKTISDIEAGINSEAQEYSYYYGLIGILYSMRYNDIKDKLIEYAVENMV